MTLDVNKMLAANQLCSSAERVSGVEDNSRTGRLSHDLEENRHEENLL